MTLGAGCAGTRRVARPSATPEPIETPPVYADLLPWVGSWWTAIEDEGGTRHLVSRR
ncbi:MAG: hypothetical protein IT379_09570 [Deltaproteobacteria bacterium]|nr:hypothetical protein [Deltaproteobacteria bacterium]